VDLINNRQGGRRRGRGGQRPNVGGQSGNRQDNRQRGNAAQLLEKYKSLARDAQLAGDRVQTEYYLQFADHYFRVLGESRARFEDQNPRRQRDDEMDDEDDGDGEFIEAGEDESGGADERSEREPRPDREPRPTRGRDREPDRDRPRFNRDERNASGAESDNERPRPARAPRMNGGGDSLPLDVLPPAIGRDEPVSADADEEPRRPRRRARGPRPADDDGGEIAPAA
jgi:hypothetical protein